MIRRRKPTEPAKVNHDRWLVSYADFITLLFGFFVVMYSVSQVNESKYKELSETLGAAFKSRSGTQVVPATSDSQLVDVAELSARMQDALSRLIESDDVNIQATDQWVEVTVNANLLFASGSATPGREAERIFAEVAELLAPYDNAVDVSGHTDNLPIRNSQFQNNWELSAARATSVVALLTSHGIAPQRLSATGYGEFRPVADNAIEEGRAANRRVVLQVARHRAERPTLAAETVADELAADARGEAPADNDGAAPAGDAAEPDAAPAAIPELGPEAPTVTEPPLQPVILEDGGLLFTNDPDATERR